MDRGVVLDPYQETAVNWLLAHEKGGLFDAPGVGKTFPAIVAAQEACPDGTKLLTVPAYLIPNWVNEIRRMYGSKPSIGVAVHDDPKRREQVLAQDVDWMLVSYNMWAQNIPLTAMEKQMKEAGATVPTRPKYVTLHRRVWPVLVFDEAHRLRGRNSQWTQAVLKTQNAERKTKTSRFWFLTGTPQVRDAGDLWPLLRLIDRTSFPGYWKFVEEWCQIIEDPWNRQVGPVRKGMEEAFRALIDKYALRRRVEDIPELKTLERLPDEMHWVKCSPAVYAAAAQMKKEWHTLNPDTGETESITSGGQLIHKLRMLTSLPPTSTNPKLAMLLDFLEDNLTEPIVVWCWYRETAKVYAEAIQKRHRPVQLFTGDSTPTEKQFALDWFRNPTPGKDAPVLVATIAAMKEGVNLQNSKTHVFVEESYLPSDNDQAVKRSLRRGQEHPVRVVYILADKSVDGQVYRTSRKYQTNILRSMLEEIRDEVTNG